jgi:hypothetical protein
MKSWLVAVQSVEREANGSANFLCYKGLGSGENLSPVPVHDPSERFPYTLYDTFRPIAGICEIRTSSADYRYRDIQKSVGS